MTTAAAVLDRLDGLADTERAQAMQRYFKTGPGEYGHGDVFLGIRVPTLRKLGSELRLMPVTELLELLRSPFHEARLLALLAMVEQYRRGNEALREQLFQAYLEHTRWINNWDLVDSSAEHIVGAHLRTHERTLLRRLAGSPSLWERRIAILATFHFIRNGEYGDTLEIAQILLEDREDLIHKAVGWMLREVGERDRALLDQFLDGHYRRMPRTMLRYAIEKHDPSARQHYLKRET